MGMNDKEGVYDLDNTPFQGIGGEDEGWIQKVSTSKTALGYDAWGRAKSVIDYSLFHGVFTFDVPREMWLEYISGVELSSNINATSVDGKLKLQGVNGQTNTVMSKRHPRYQPNKGHLYSSSMLLPDYTEPCNQEFGLLHSQAGVFFRANAGVLYAVRRTMVSGVVSEVAEAITLPIDIDLAKGNVYDIQMQWRGVGNIYFYIDQALVHTMELLGTLDELSVWNPALPVGFSVDGTASIYCGCVDITSEGGHQENRQRGSVDTDEVNLSTGEVPVLLVHVPSTITYGGVEVMNTRDHALRRIAGYADDATIIKMYHTRDGSKFTGTVYIDVDLLHTIDYSVDGDIVVDNLTTNINRIITRRIQANGNIEMINPDAELGDVFMTHGDYVLVTMQAKNATLGGASMEWGSEI